MRILTTILATFLLTSLLPASAGELRVYSFTSDFIRCVKVHDEETREHTNVGNADSGLMNGKNVLSGDFKGNYWSYMNCLSHGNSGTASETLTVNVGCGSHSFPLRGKVYNLPPGRKGKIVGAKGNYFRCDGASGGGSGWVSITSARGIPSGAGDTDDGDGTCESESITKNSCEFELADTRHGAQVEDFFGPGHGDDTSSFGKVRAVCRGGSFEVVEESCEAVRCDGNAIVNWHSATGSCKATVGLGGTVLNEKSPKKYFPSLSMARDKTRVVEGEAEFVCNGSRWGVKPGTQPTCSTKSREQLSCYSSGDGKKHYCE